MSEAKIREAFALFDKDGDGQLDNSDFISAFRSLGVNPSHKELQGMMGKKDMLSWDDFTKAAVAYMKGKDPVADLKKRFELFDREKNGTVSTGELKQVLSSLGDKLQAEEIEQFVKQFDPSDSGSIKYTNVVDTLLA